KHRPARPLFTEEDAYAALERFVEVPFGEQRSVADGMAMTLWRTPHILGASSVQLTLGSSTVLLSGDLGRADHPVLADGGSRADADVLVVESTYGDRMHEPGQESVRLLGDTI